MTAGQTKKRAALALTAVFVAGAVLGIATTRFYTGRGRPSDLTPRQYRGYLLDSLTKELGLTIDQQAKVEEILDEIGERFQSVRDAIEPEMEAIRMERAERIMLCLQPQQRARYEKILNERRRRREAYHRQVFRGNSRRRGNDSP